MSKAFAVLEKAASEAAGLPRASRITDPPGTYAGLIQQLFQSPSVVAVVESGIASGAGDVCHGIAAELAAAEKRVVIVPVGRLLQINPLPAPDENTLTAGPEPNIWLWPKPSGQQIEFFKNRGSASPGGWLDVLRQRFDAVLLACPSPHAAPGVTEVAAMADSSVMVVEAGRTLRQRLHGDRRALQMGGAKLVGCVWIWPEAARR